MPIRVSEAMQLMVPVKIKKAVNRSLGFVFSIDRINALFEKTLGHVVDYSRKLRREYVIDSQLKNLHLFREYCEHCSVNIRHPYFVKIGANDGLTGDPCSEILLRHANWRGLLVEPVPYCFQRLRENFSDTTRYTLEPVAVGREAGSVKFYYVSEDAKQNIKDLPAWYDQIGSFSREHILKHLEGSLEPYVCELTLESIPLSAILLRNDVQICNLLHIDTEGFDYEVLQTLDFSKIKPGCIFIEHAHLSVSERDGMSALLRTQGYIVRDCGADLFALLEYSKY